MKEGGQFRRGIALFNAGRFFEAHEVWEQLWLEEPLPERTFLQGLIQVAAAFFHHSRGNPRGQRSLLAAGLAKLEQFSGEHRGIALAKLRADVRDWVQTPDAGGEDRSPKVPRIRLAARAGRKSQRGG
jgi:predicted metal-dependent hydrolase